MILLHQFGFRRSFANLFERSGDLHRQDTLKIDLLAALIILKCSSGA